LARARANASAEQVIAPRRFNLRPNRRNMLAGVPTDRVSTVSNTSKLANGIVMAVQFMKLQA
jgi:hypothetical protein